VGCSSAPEPAFLACCRRLLKDRGALLIEAPDFGSRMARRQKAAWLPLYPDTHLYHFTLASLSRLLVKSGFQAVRRLRYGGLGVVGAPAPGSPQPPVAADFLRARLSGALRLLRRAPALKRVLRYLYWQILQMNDHLAVLAVKSG